MHSDLPELFKLYVGGFLGPSYEIELEGDGLVYRLSEDGPEPQAVLRIDPGTRRWRSFWKRMDALEVWNWLPHYPNPGVTDGTGWSVEISKGERWVSSHGSNNYPDRGGLPDCSEPSREFREFCRAVRRLLGFIPFE